MPWEWYNPGGPPASIHLPGTEAGVLAQDWHAYRGDEEEEAAAAAAAAADEITSAPPEPQTLRVSLPSCPPRSITTHEHRSITPVAAARALDTPPAATSPPGHRRPPPTPPTAGSVSLASPLNGWQTERPSTSSTAPGESRVAGGSQTAREHDRSVAHIHGTPRNFPASFKPGARRVMQARSPRGPMTPPLPVDRFPRTGAFPVFLSDAVRCQCMQACVCGCMVARLHGGCM